MHWFAQECAERGEDFDIAKLRDVGADETDRIDRKRKKKNPDQGFAGMWNHAVFFCANIISGILQVCQRFVVVKEDC